MPKKIIKDGREVTVFDATDPEDMKIADKLAKAQLATMEGGQSEEQFSKEAEIEAKLENASEAEKVFSEMRSKVEGWYEEKGLNAPKIDSRDSLKGAISNFDKIEKLEQNQKPKKEIVGSLPLEGNIRASEGYKEGYASEKELIEDLRSKSRLGGSQGAQAEQILGQLLVKSLKGVRDNRQGMKEFVPQEGSETEIQRLNRHWREKQVRNRNRD